MVNRYDQPAQASFVNDVLPIPFAQLYQIGSAMNQQVQAANDQMNQFYEKYAQFQSPSNIDTQNNYNMTIGKFQPIAQQLMDNPDLIKTPEGRSMINNTIRNVDYAGLAKLRQSRDQMLQDQELSQRLQAAGLFNPNWHGVDYSNYDTLGFGGQDALGNQMKGIFHRNLVPYRDIATATAKYYDALQPEHIGYQGNNNELEVYGISQDRLHEATQKNLNAFIEGDQLGQMYYQDALRTVGQMNSDQLSQISGNTLQDKARNWVGMQMEQAANEHRVQNLRINPQYALEMQYGYRYGPNATGIGSRSTKTAGSGVASPPSLSSWWINTKNIAGNTQAQAIANAYGDNLKSHGIPNLDNLFKLSDATIAGTFNIVNPSQITGFRNAYNQLRKSGASIQQMNKFVNDFSTILPQSVGDQLKDYITNGMMGEIQSQIRQQSEAASRSGNRSDMPLVNAMTVTDASNKVLEYLQPNATWRTAPNKNNEIFERTGNQTLTDDKETIPIRITNLHRSGLNKPLLTNPLGVPLSDYEPSMFNDIINDTANYAGGDFGIRGKHSALGAIEDKKAEIRNTYAQLPNLLKFISDNLPPDLKISSTGEIKPIQTKDATNPSLYAQTDAYVEKEKMHDIVERYSKLPGVNVSKSNLLDMLEGKLANVGQGRAVMTYRKGLKLNNEKDGQNYYAVHMLMPFNESLSAASTAAVENSYLDRNSAKMRDAAMGLGLTRSLGRDPVQGILAGQWQIAYQKYLTAALQNPNVSQEQAQQFAQQAANQEIDANSDYILQNYNTQNYSDQYDTLEEQLQDQGEGK